MLRFNEPFLSLFLAIFSPFSFSLSAASSIGWNSGDSSEDAYNLHGNVEPLKNLWTIPPRMQLLPENEPIRPDAIRIVAIGDTHSHSLSSLSLPPGDILIHTGDLTQDGTTAEMHQANKELGQIAHKYRKIIVIAGNHDFCLDTLNPAERKTYGQNLLSNAHYLFDDSVTFFGIKFYGSPWVPKIKGHAFGLERGVELDECWNSIPSDTDVLITHTPPLGVLDVNKEGIHEGCLALANHVINRVKPRFHLFGHIHGAHGVISNSNNRSTTFINTAICFFDNKVRYRPVVFDIPLRNNNFK